MELVNQITKRWINAYIGRPRATLLIDSAGDTELGMSIANFVYSQLATSKQIPLVQVELQDKKSIGIEDMRLLKKSIQLRANSDGEYTRFVLIPNADVLTEEAQNAVLKLIEELPEKTIFMLVVSSKESVLQTIQSRCFIIPVFPITHKQALDYALSKGVTRDESNRAYAIADGNASMYKRLLQNKDDAMYQLVASAKLFLQNSTFERQEFVRNLTDKKSKFTCEEFLIALKITAKTGMRHASTPIVKKQWQQTLQHILHAQEQLQKNVQQKLVMLALSISI